MASSTLAARMADRQARLMAGAEREGLILAAKVRLGTLALVMAMQAGTAHDHGAPYAYAAGVLLLFVLLTGAHWWAAASGPALRPLVYGLLALDVAGLALFFVGGSLLWFLPVVGIEMLPIGLLLVAQDVPFLRRPVGRAMVWLERTHWHRHDVRGRGQRRQPRLSQPPLQRRRPLLVPGTQLPAFRAPQQPHRVDQGGAPGDVAAQAAERLAERALHHVDHACRPVPLRHPGTSCLGPLQPLPQAALAVSTKAARARLTIVKSDGDPGRQPSCHMLLACSP
jgi:hypothetical protein